MCFNSCDRCLKGNDGRACFGCVSTKCAIHTIAILSSAELAFITYEFSAEMISGKFNWIVFTWMFICFIRVLAWI